MSTRARPLVLVAPLLGCQPGAGVATGTDSDAGSATDATGTGAATDTTGSTGSDPTGDAGPWPGEGMLACEAPPCLFLFAVQTLDDRIEIFAPDTAAPYRGTLHLDLKPNLDGDNSGDRLDEPYELAVGGGRLLATVGHYPTRESGSLLAVPLQLLADQPVGAAVPTDAYFDGVSFGAGVVHRPLQGLEPIFVHLQGSRLLVAQFSNDLFAAEDTWTVPGELIVADVDDPSLEPGRVVLSDLMGESCAGAAEIVSVGGGRIAVACDGNEAVALLDVSGVDAGTPAQAAASIVPQQLCDLPASSGVRVRHLAPAGAGGVVVAEAPATASTDPARLWTFSGSCDFGSFGNIAEGSAGGLTRVVRVPGQPMVLVGGTVGRRGIYPVIDSGSSLDACDPVPGVGPLLKGADGGDLEPVGLALDPAGTRVAIGAGPFSPSSAVAGFGRVLWGELVSDGTCATDITNIVDLTDGASGHAAAVTAGDPSTWRRAPSVLLIHEVTD